MTRPDDASKSQPDTIKVRVCRLTTSELSLTLRDLLDQWSTLASEEARSQGTSVSEHDWNLPEKVRSLAAEIEKVKFLLGSCELSVQK